MCILLQMLPVSIVFRVIGGLLYPGDTLPYLIFTNFAYQLVIGTVGFLSCFKLGHYMKIPPKSMFLVVVSFFDLFYLLLELYTKQFSKIKLSLIFSYVCFFFFPTLLKVPKVKY